MPTDEDDDVASDAASIIPAILPALAADVFGFGVLGLLLGAGVAGAAVRENRLLMLRVRALEDHVRDVARIAAAERPIPIDELRDAFQRPDIAFLVAMGRDHYAVAGLRDRLRRLAAVTAARIPADAGAPFDRTLAFARAALDLDVVAVEFLIRGDDLASRKLSAVHSTIPTFEQDCYAGESWMHDFLAARTWTDAQEVERAAAALDALLRHGFAFREGRGNDQVRAIQAGDRLARFFSFTLAPTDLGRAFVAEIRAAGPA